MSVKPWATASSTAAVRCGPTAHIALAGECESTRPVRSPSRHLAAAAFQWGLASLIAPAVTFGQASPFMTGMTALQTNVLGWLTPLAIILVMALGAMAMANRMSWGWCIGAIFGIAIAFGAPQIVSWVRGMFGV